VGKGLFLFLILYQAIACSQNSNYLSTAATEAEGLMNYSACFLAKEKLESALEKTNKTIASNYYDVGEAYRVLALINYEIGFNRQYKSLVDSIYTYKKKLNEPIYFVEYAAYKLRGYAMDHNYAPALKLIDTAKSVLSFHREKAHLIDTLFFKLNEYNIYRNKIPHVKRIDNTITNWKAFKEYEKINWEAQKDPFIRALYYRYLGNIMQDLVYYRPTQYSNLIADSAFSKSIYYYEKGRKLIQDTLGFDNFLSLRMKLMVAHQYSKNTPQIEKCLGGYRETIEGLTLAENGRDYFRDLSMSLSIQKMYTNILINFNKTEEFDQSISRLNRLWKYRRLFVSIHQKQSPNKLIEGYSSNTSDDLLNLYFSKLSLTHNYQDSLLIIEKIWNLQSCRFEPSNYLEVVKRIVGETNFEKWNSELDEIQLEQLKYLDELFLIQNGILEDKDKDAILEKIEELERKYDAYLSEKPVVFRNFQKGNAQQTLEEVRSEMSEDEAMLVQFDVATIILTSEKKAYSLIIKKYEARLVENEVLKLGDRVTMAYDIHTAEWKKAAFYQYSNFFSSAQAYLKQMERVKVFVPPKYSLLNFDYFVSDTTINNYADIPFLGKKYAFSYTKNPTVDYLNSQQKINSRTNGIFMGDCGEGSKNYTTPFINQLVNYLSEFFETESISTKEQLFKNENSYNTFQSFSHGEADSSFYRNDYRYNSQDKYDHNYIVTCDGGISISQIDSINLHAKLAVIASCNSGSGFVDQGSAKFDFSKVLIKNGSQTVVTANHEIDDQATAIILKSFYTNLEHGDFASIALQKAKLKYLSEIEDPELYKAVYWAGLRIDGLDQRIKLGESKKYNWLWVALGSMILLLVAALLKKKLNSKV
jgi:hypothetical protein